MEFLVKKIIMVYYHTKYWNLDFLFDDAKWILFLSYNRSSMYDILPLINPVQISPY